MLTAEYENFFFFQNIVIKLPSSLTTVSNAKMFPKLHCHFRNQTWQSYISQKTKPQFPSGGKIRLSLKNSHTFYYAIFQTKQNTIFQATKESPFAFWENGGKFNLQWHISQCFNFPIVMYSTQPIYKNFHFSDESHKPNFQPTKYPIRKRKLQSRPRNFPTKRSSTMPALAPTAIFMLSASFPSLYR